MRKTLIESLTHGPLTEQAGDRAVHDQHEPDVRLGGAERGEHAQGALPALRHDGERGRGHQPDEDQAEHRDDQQEDDDQDKDVP